MRCEPSEKTLTEMIVERFPDESSEMIGEIEECINIALDLLLGEISDVDQKSGGSLQ